MKTGVKDLDKYIKQVQENQINTCVYVKQAVARFLDDLENADSKGIYFDVKAVNHVILFFGLLKHSKGRWAGKVFKLEPWQVFILANLFGWKNKETGLRRFTQALLMVARKNGKSTFISGICLYMAFMDKEPGAEVYAAASHREQARIIHGEAVRMVWASQALWKHIKIMRDLLIMKSTNSIFKPLGKDVNTMDGLNIHCGAVDELHKQKADLWGILETATGARDQPLVIGITTAGHDRQSFCWQLMQYLISILEGKQQDESFFGYIATMDKEDDWLSIEAWEKANPNLGISVNKRDLERKAVKAQAMPTALNSFLNLHLNVWTQSSIRWINDDIWMSCDDQVPEDDLIGKTCYAGLDLASNRDITAFVLVFPMGPPSNTRYVVKSRFFIPLDTAQVRAKEDNVPYLDWIDKGLIIATPGMKVNYNAVKKQIVQDSRKYDLREAAFDPWNATQICIELEKEGLTMVRYSQSYKVLSPATKELDVAIAEKRIIHGGDPVLRWMAGNVVLSTDSSENVKPDKAKSTERIDGIVALIMAYDRALRQAETESIYERRGVIIFNGDNAEKADNRKGE